MPDTLIKSRSLFFQGLDSNNGNVMLNKRHIVSAIQTGPNTVEVTMTSGEVFDLNMDATMFGELIYLLHEVQHWNSELPRSSSC